MVRTMLSAAFAAAVTLTPVHAQDLGEIVGGVARQYLEQEQDRAAFAQAQGTDTRAAYQSYLRQFPNGAYAAQARDRVQQLGGTTTAPVTQNQGDTAGLSRQQRVQVQRQLNGLGYSTNGADGNFGPGTRRAIALWQRDRNYAQTGTLNAAQANEILQGTATTRPAATTTASVGPAGNEADLGLSLQQRQAVQAGLTQRGFDTRGVDGVFGQGTRNAIASWQRVNDMEATGYLTAAQYDRLVAR